MGSSASAIKSGIWERMVYLSCNIEEGNEAVVAGIAI